MDRRNLIKKLLSIFVSICVCLTILIIKLSSFRNKNIFPTINQEDIFNNKIDSKILTASLLYVQFMDEKEYESIDLYKKIVSNWKNSPLEILIITNSKSIIYESLADFPVNIKIVAEKFDSLKYIFKTKINRWYLYNKGRLLATEHVARGDQKIETLIRKYLYKKEYDASLFIRLKSKINDFSWLSQLKDYQSEEKYLLVGLVTSLCDICGTGIIVDTLHNYRANYRGYINVVLITNERYSLQDLDVIKSQIRASFNISIANNALFNKWNELISLYGTAYLNNIMILIDKNGYIIDISDQKCNCLRTFKYRLDNLLRSSARSN